jgi:hypothetical protein
MKWETRVSLGGGKDAEFGGSYTIKSDYLVSGTGQLNTPKPLNVLGVEDYQGKLFHSARWDWSYDMEGKRIAVVGTGSSIHPDMVYFLDRYRAADLYRSNDCSSCSGGRKDRKASYCGPTEPCLGHTAPRPGDPGTEAYNAEVGPAHPLAIPRRGNGPARVLLPRGNTGRLSLCSAYARNEP